MQQPRSRGFTLIEVTISFVILLVLALAILSATLPLERATTRGNVDLDLDRNARRVLAEIRREVRQSGEGGGVDRITIPPKNTPPDTVETAEPADGAAATVNLLQYRMRTGPDESTDWGTQVTIRAVPDEAYRNVPANSVHRYRLERIQGGNTVIIARNVSRVMVARPAGGSTVEITISMSRADPHRANAATVPVPITQTHTDRIEYYNK